MQWAAYIGCDKPRRVPPVSEADYNVGGHYDDRRVNTDTPSFLKIRMFTTTRSATLTVLVRLFT